MDKDMFFRKAIRNDPVSSMGLIGIFIALVAVLVLCLFIKTGDTSRSVNISMFILAWSVGSLLGIMTSPYTAAEKKGFSSTAKIATAFLAGMFTDAIRGRVAESILGKEHLFVISAVLSTVILSFMFAYILRAYLVANIYDGHTVEPEK